MHSWLKSLLVLRWMQKINLIFPRLKDAKTDVTSKAKQKSTTEKYGEVPFADLSFCDKRIALIAFTYMLRIVKTHVNCTLVDTQVDLFWASISFPMMRNYQFKELINYS
jgi:hypothetical protein